jgi:serine protease Do
MMDSNALRKFFLFVVCLLFSGYPGYSQNVNWRKLEQLINKAIETSYPSSVRIFSYDPVHNLQMSAVFSGVVVSKDGYILTAAHVTSPGGTYKVIFPDGTACVATGLGKIEYSHDRTVPDVAMIKITTEGTWPYAEMGSSSSLKEDEPCISISYPESFYQLFPIVRFGYIANVKNQRGFIQSTCIMEPGDSGGPLFDCFGRVIGLHSAIGIPEQENYEIPVDMYRKYWAALTIPRVYQADPDKQCALKDDAGNLEVISIPALKHLDAAFHQNALKLKKICVSVFSGDRTKKYEVNGTLFSLRGLAINPAGNNQSVVVSKSSLVGDNPVILVADHIEIPAKIIARDRNNDLVLLQPETEIRGGVECFGISNDAVNMRPGKFLLSPQPDTHCIASISGSKPFNMPKGYNSGYLGISFKYRNDSIAVNHVFDGPAGSLDIRAGDVLIGINNVPVKSGNDYAQLLQKSWPGDTVDLHLLRAGFAFSKTIILGTWPDAVIDHPAAFFAGGKSVRRDGFDQVFTHDAIIKPYQCGGPVFDLYGHFYGINIARFSRAACLAIPGGLINNFIKNSIINNQRKF